MAVSVSPALAGPIEYLFKYSATELLDSAHTMLPYLPQLKYIGNWINLVKVARHPGVLWNINYIEPSDVLVKLNELIVESEKIFFVSPDSTEIKDDFYAENEELAYFHIIRAYLRAEEGNIASSMKIWNQLYSTWLFRQHPQRKSNLLAHLYKVFMCTKELDMAAHCINKLWTEISITEQVKRYEYGMWDNLTNIFLVQWVFSYYVDEIASNLTSELANFQILRHKRQEIAPLICKDTQWLVATCSRPFYDHARNLMPTLPSYDIAKMTQNELPTKSKNESQKELYKNYKNALDCKDSIGIPEFHRHAFNLFFEDREKFDNCYVWSDFWNKHGPDIESVLDIGCGLSKKTYDIFKDKNLVALDLSDVVVDHWNAQDREIIQMPAHEYLPQSPDFDLCVFSDSLDYIFNYDMVLRQCSLKCKYILISVSLIEFVVHSASGIIDFNRVVLSCNEWEQVISKHFDIIATEGKECNPCWFLMLGKSKNIH